MRPRYAVLLTPLESADPTCLLISIINAPVTPLESALTDPSQLTENTAALSLLECTLTRFSPATPLESALPKNTGGGGLSIPIQNRPLATPRSARYSSSFFSHPCALFCAFLHSEKTQLFYFQSLPHCLPKTSGVGVGYNFSVHKPLQGPRGFDPISACPSSSSTNHGTRDTGHQSPTLLHCSTHGSPTPRPTLPRRSPLARRDRARYSRFAAFHSAAPARRSTLLDRNRFGTR